MASPEIIGLLCAGATNYHAVGGGFAGDKLSRGELAGLLAGLDAPAMNLAMAKYAGDLDAERMLMAQVRVWAAGLANREGWQVVKGRPTISNMSALAVFEVVRPSRCGRCDGTGFRSTKVCTTCHGIGVKALSGRQVAEGMMIDHVNFIRLWKKRYEACFAYVCGLDASVRYALNRNDRCADYKHLKNAC